MNYYSIGKNSRCGYSNERMYLAQKCAEELHLKPFNPLLYEIGAKKSDIPEREINSEKSEAMEEQSLLSMGLVYSYGGSLSVIDVTGHTYLFPIHPVIIQELENCGYCVCEYGESSPKPKKEFDEEKEYTTEQLHSGWKFEERKLERKTYLNKIRNQYTLSPELARKVSRLEHFRKMTPVSSTLPEDEFYPPKKIELPYDVFGDDLYFGIDYTNPGHVMTVLKVLGAAAMETRKFLLCTGYGHKIDGIEESAKTIPGLVAAYRNGEILNNNLYFSRDGVGYNFEHPEELLSQLDDYLKKNGSGVSLK